MNTRVPVALALIFALATPSVALAQVPPPPKKGAAPAAAAAPAPEPAADPNANLSEEEKAEKAKGLYGEAEALAGKGDYAAATPKYEEAYFLVPGKHGFAYKVGYSAWQVKDCVKADQYLKHFVKYGDPNKQADWMNEAKSILGEISASGCAEQATPATTPTTTTTEPVGDDDDAPILTGTREQREEENRKAKNQADNEKKGMLIGGAVLIGLGVGFVGMGVGMNFFAKSNTDKLEDLSSNGTSTGFPQGSWPEEGEKADQNRKIGNALAITGYAAGGVMLATGVALVVLHVKRKGGGGKNAKAGNGKAELTGIGPAMFDRGGGFAASLRF